MPQAEESDIRAALMAAIEPKPGSWVTGVGLDTRSAGTIEATSARLEGDVAILSTPAGERRISLADIEDVLIHVRSPGPE